MIDIIRKLHYLQALIVKFPIFSGHYKHYSCHWSSTVQKCILQVVRSELWLEDKVEQVQPFLL